MLLEKGTVLYGHNHFGASLNRYVISKITDKQASVIIKRVNSSDLIIKFDREIGDGSFIRVKGHKTGYDATTYSIETPELCEKYKRQKLEIKFNNIDIKRLSTVDLEAIVSIVNKNENKQSS